MVYAEFNILYTGYGAIDNPMVVQYHPTPSNKDIPSDKQFCPYQRGVLWSETASYAFKALAVRCVLSRGASSVESVL